MTFGCELIDQYRGSGSTMRHETEPLLQDLGPRRATNLPLRVLFGDLEIKMTHR